MWYIGSEPRPIYLQSNYNFLKIYNVHDYKVKKNLITFYLVAIGVRIIITMCSKITFFSKDVIKTY
jgi:hypothetical protein